MSHSRFYECQYLLWFFKIVTRVGYQNDEWLVCKLTLMGILSILSAQVKVFIIPMSKKKQYFAGYAQFSRSKRLRVYQEYIYIYILTYNYVSLVHCTRYTENYIVLKFNAEGYYRNQKSWSFKQLRFLPVSFSKEDEKKT